MFLPRHILKINDYAFQDGDGFRDKYMIILNRDEEHAYILHTLTTSQPNGFNPKKLGCHKEKEVSYYYMPKNVIVAENGFTFNKDTFVFFVGNIRKESLNILNKYPVSNVDSKGVMDKKILKELIDCMLLSIYITPEQADCLRKTRNTL